MTYADTKRKEVVFTVVQGNPCKCKCTPHIERLFHLKQTNSHKSFSFHLTDSVWPQGHWRPSIQTIFIWVNQCVKRQLRGQQARLKLIQTGNNTQQEDTTDDDLAFIAKITEICRRV